MNTLPVGLPRAALLLALLVLVGCARTPLLERLDERQANEVVAVLLRHNIAAEKHDAGKTGYVVRVAPRDLAEAIELVQRQALPSAPRTQVGAAFPSDSLVSTPLAERARLISAVEQRLEESLKLIEGVEATRVHLNYDVNLGGEGRRPDGRRMHVAAVVSHVPGVDEEALLQAVKRFLRNTFNGIDYDNVSVILTEVDGPRTLAVTRADNAGAPWALLAAVGLLVGAALLAAAWTVLRSVPAVGRAVRRVQQRWRRRRGGARVA
ncbi:type III secretion inner membrane ring lipoprotein SctJ [Stenotrophomonas sp.]|uniref:type III secretion system inner membrane ring lipoprotein SctJ n=1 Tax=Stenotrophomonas sp. TaxID=69392 RepID=UPI002FC70DD0